MERFGCSNKMVQKYLDKKEMFDIKEFHPSIFKDTRKHLLNTKNIYIY